MSKMMMLLLAGGVALLSSCATEKERKPVPPTSAHGNMPWNVPQAGEGAGALGGILEGR